MDNYGWKLTQGKPLAEGPLLTKEYNYVDESYVFVNDFLGDHVTRWLLSGTSETLTDGEGVLNATHGLRGESETLTDGEAVLNPLRSLSGASESLTHGTGMLNLLNALAGVSEATTDGEGLLNLLWGLSGDSETLTDGEAVLNLLAALTGESETLTDGEAVLNLLWGLAGESETLTDGEGVLNLLWGLVGESETLTGGAGTLMIIRYIGGTATVLTSGAGILRLWPLTAVLSDAPRYVVTLEAGPRYTVMLEVVRLNIIGNTVRLHAEFRDSAGQLEDADDVKVRIYDGGRNLLEEHDVAPYATGQYQHNYTIPQDPVPGILYYEFAGECGTYDAVGRSTLERVWAD